MPENAAPAASSMRQLWSDQVVFTRKYIKAAVGGRPVSEVLTKALGSIVAPIATAPAVRDLVPQFGPGDAAAVGVLSTMEAIGDRFGARFGPEAGKELTKLLRQHVLIAVELLAAARSGNLSKFKAEDDRWIANADQIVELLSSLNEHWPREVLAEHLHLLMKLTRDEAVARIAGNFDVDLRTFDHIYAEAMVIADMLEEGLVEKSSRGS